MRSLVKGFLPSLQRCDQTSQPINARPQPSAARHPRTAYSTASSSRRSPAIRWRGTTFLSTVRLPPSCFTRHGVDSAWVADSCFRRPRFSRRILKAATSGTPNNPARLRTCLCSPANCPAPRCAIRASRSGMTWRPSSRAGLSPLIATALLAHYHASWPVALFLIVPGLVAVVTLKFTHERGTGKYSLIPRRRFGRCQPRECFGTISLASLRLLRR